MKNLFIALLALSSASSFAAGDGSTTDFQMTALGGYTLGCEGIEELDNLRQIACHLGMNLKKAGLSQEQLETTLYDLPDFESVCSEK